MRAAVLRICIVVVACGCGDEAEDGSSGSGSCAAIASRLTSCGLLASGSSGLAGCYEPTHAIRRCELRCISNGGCADLEVGLCGEPLEELYFDSSTAVGACQDACRARAAFSCTDGSNPIDGATRCDGFDDCGDGADEQGCPMFTCGDGAEVVDAVRCNGIDDCADDSDEDGCGIFRCADSGEETLPYWRCDGVSHCDDGSDELGCPQYVCG